MPSNSAANRPSNAAAPGHLYVVATPIGNMADITLRAIEVLTTVDIVAAEDTRRAGKLLKAYDIASRLVSYHEHNERERTPRLIRRLEDGAAVALISNAGTPTVSDPGYRLVTAAVGNGIPVVPVPGAAAPIAALSASGLATDSFTFVGFLDRKKQKRLKQIQAMKFDPRTQVLYESPKRLPALIEALTDELGDRQAVLAREMTKRHEEFVRGPLSHILAVLKGRGDLRGECTLLISGGNVPLVSNATLRGAIHNALRHSDEKPAAVARSIAEKLGVAKKTVYDEMLKIRNK